ncbi:2-hydroxyacid dehydrogenase [Arthrobacter halodurans]|uniref:2-hydroxyacid dehydrogenase n=1 Tax=Arthrobacter halodurans TaxID=516699 RepID=A0ABV4UQ46_9MICC
MVAAPPGAGPLPTGSAEVLDVVVTDPIISTFADRLVARAPSHRWSFLADASPAARADDVARADVVVCSRMSPEEARTVASARLVHVTGAGVDRVAVGDLPASTAVANTFHHARPIAEHVMMTTLALVRRLLPTDRELRAGTWRTILTDPSAPLHPTLDTMTLGLVGLGTIGAETALLAAGFGMDVVAVRHRPEAPLPDGVSPRWVGGDADLHRLLAESDVVVVTVPLSPATEGLIGAAELDAMRETAFLVNVARGPVVAQDALHRALSRGTIAGAALDVWWGTPEPGRTPPADFPFAELDNVILTPHYSGLASSTFERRVVDIAANIEAVASGAPLRNRVRSAAAS